MFKKCQSSIIQRQLKFWNLLIYCMHINQRKVNFIRFIGTTNETNDARFYYYAEIQGEINWDELNDKLNKFSI